MFAAYIALTIGFFLAAAVIMPINLSLKASKERHKPKAKRGSRTGVLKKLVFHLKARVKRRKPTGVSAPLREWEERPLNKLKLYKNYIFKKAEIAPIR